MATVIQIDDALFWYMSSKMTMEINFGLCIVWSESVGEKYISIFDINSIELQSNWAYLLFDYMGLLPG